MSETGNKEEVGKKPTKPTEEQSQPKKESLKEAVMAVLQCKSLNAAEILDALRKRGRKFSAKRPINSIRVLLYSQKKMFNNAWVYLA
jgi:hypothetical protein